MRYTDAMNSYIFEIEQLNRLLSDFYTAVGVAAVLYDAEGNEVVKSPMYAVSCAALRRCEGFRALCDRSDAMHLTEARAAGGTLRYTCHAGMCEVIKPIYYDEVLIAFLQIGQFRLAGSEKKGEHLFLSAAEAAGGASAEALSSFRAMPLIGQDRLAAIERMMDTVIRSLFADGLIRGRRSMHSVRLSRYIEEHLGEPIAIPALAAQHGLSRHALYRIFAEEFKMTPTAYINARRLGRAAVLLAEGDLPVSAVAAAVGFDDYNYFIRLFRRAYGATPLAYRRASR